MRVITALPVMLACGTGGGDSGANMAAPQDAACAIQGPYRLVISLIAGSSAPIYDDDRSNPLGASMLVLGCQAGAAGVAMIPSSDTAACSLVACVGDRCSELACAPGAPVEECAASETYDRAFSCGCPSAIAHRAGEPCPAECITSMRCDYSWRLSRP